jgi:hypothetical protein
MTEWNVVEHERTILVQMSHNQSKSVIMSHQPQK